MEFIRYMAMTEAKRKNCPKCILGNYNHNEVMCITCNKDCPYITLAHPTEEAIEEAKDAIKKYRGIENENQ